MVSPGKSIPRRALVEEGESLVCVATLNRTEGRANSGWFDIVNGRLIVFFICICQNWMLICDEVSLDR